MYSQIVLYDQEKASNLERIYCHRWFFRFYRGMHVRFVALAKTLMLFCDHDDE